MKKDSVKNGYLAKILLCFGLVTLLTSMIDIITTFIFPDFGNVQWLNTNIQELSEQSIMPALGILFILIGINLYNYIKFSRFWLNIEKIFGILNFLFVLCFSIIIIVYFITIAPVQNNAIMSINKQTNTVKSNINQVYNSNKSIISKQRLGESLDNVNKTNLQQVKLTKSILLKNNVKTLINLILFTLIYLMMGIISFKSANLEINSKKVHF